MIHNNSFPKGRYPLVVAWHFRNAAGEPYDISGYNLSVVYRTSRGEIPVDSFSFSEEGDSISWVIPTSEQKWAGIYSLFLKAEDMATGEQVFRVAYQKAFALTSSVCDPMVVDMTEDEDDKVINLYTVAKYTMFSNTPVITVDEQGYFVSDGERMRYSGDGKYAKVVEKLSELADDTQHRLVTDTEKQKISDAYIKPTGGIHESDLDASVRKKLNQGGGGGSGVEVIDNLESDSADAALSANQGRTLNIMMNSRVLEVMGEDMVTSFAPYLEDLTQYAMIHIRGVGRIIPVQNSLAGWLFEYQEGWRISEYLEDFEVEDHAFYDLMDYLYRYSSPISPFGVSNEGDQVSFSGDFILNGQNISEEKVDKKKIIYLDNEDSFFDIEPGAYYRYDGDLNHPRMGFSFNKDDEHEGEEMILQFSTSANVPVIEWDGIKMWLGGEPTINPNKTYVVSVQNGLGVIGEF